MTAVSQKRESEVRSTIPARRIAPLLVGSISVTHSFSR